MRGKDIKSPPRCCECLLAESKAAQFLKTKRYLHSFIEKQKSVLNFCESFNMNKLKNYTLNISLPKYSWNTDGFTIPFYKCVLKYKKVLLLFFSLYLLNEDNVTLPAVIGWLCSIGGNEIPLAKGFLLLLSVQHQHSEGDSLTKITKGSHSV